MSIRDDLRSTSASAAAQAIADLRDGKGQLYQRALTDMRDAAARGATLCSWSSVTIPSPGARAALAERLEADGLRVTVDHFMGMVTASWGDDE